MDMLKSRRFPIYSCTLLLIPLFLSVVLFKGPNIMKKQQIKLEDLLRQPSTVVLTNVENEENPRWFER